MVEPGLVQRDKHLYSRVGAINQPGEHGERHLVPEGEDHSELVATQWGGRLLGLTSGHRAESEGGEFCATKSVPPHGRAVLVLEEAQYELFPIAQRPRLLL